MRRPFQRGIAGRLLRLCRLETVPQLIDLGFERLYLQLLAEDNIAQLAHGTFQEGDLGFDLFDRLIDLSSHRVPT
jgi:hypothetical protein